MFTPGIHGAGNKTQSKTYQIGQIIGVQTGQDLLRSPARQEQIQFIREKVRIPEEHFSAFYLQLLQTFAGYVQVLPVSLAAVLGSILNESLMRAEIALEVLNQEIAAETEPLLIYAVFSAALLWEVRFLVLGQMIFICNEEGLVQSRWEPHAGSMPELGAQFYKIRSYQGPEYAVQFELQLLLAKTIMPTWGLEWLMSDREIWTTWVKAIAGGDLTGTRWDHWKQIIQKKFEQRLARMTWLPEEWPLKESTTALLGEEFMVWLQQGLSDGRIAFNEPDAKVHVVDDGVFIELSLFKEFTKPGVNLNHIVVYQAVVNAWGLIEMSGDDYRHRQYFEKAKHLIGGQQTGQKNVKSAGSAFSEAQRLREQPVVKTGLVLPVGGVFTQGKIPATVNYLQSAGRELASQLPSLAKKAMQTTLRTR